MRYPPLRNTVARCQRGLTYQGLRREGKYHSHASTRGLDFEILRQAIEERNADTLIGFYSDEA